MKEATVEQSKSLQATKIQKAIDTLRGPKQTKNKKKDLLITNITGQASDKLRLTTRLNDAVDNLIKMGNKYKQRSSLDSTQMPNMLSPSVKT